MKKILPGCFCLAFIACAPPTQFLVKTYPPAQLDSKTVLLYPLSAGQVEVANPDDFADDFEDVKSEPGIFLSKEINDNAAGFFTEGFKHVQVLNGADSNLAPMTSNNSQKITEKIGADEFEIRVPNSLYLESKGLKPKFVLVLDHVIYSRNLESSQSMVSSAPAMTNVGGKMVSTGAAPMMVNSSKQYIAMGANYVLYDYEEKAVAGYGFVKGEKTFTFAMTRSDWYASMKNAFGAIAKFTPFK